MVEFRLIPEPVQEHESQHLERAFLTRPSFLGTKAEKMQTTLFLVEETVVRHLFLHPIIRPVLAINGTFRLFFSAFFCHLLQFQCCGFILSGKKGTPNGFGLF